MQFCKYLIMFSLLRDLLFTPQCVSCAQIGSHLCQPCAAYIRPYVSSTNDFPIWSAAPYGGWLRDHIIAYKNGAQFERHGLAEVLKLVIASAEIREPFILVPVPSSANKIRERGFDTIRMLCQAMQSTPMCLGVAKNFILLNRAVDDQVGQSSAQRRTNVENAFSPTRRHAPGNYVIVDDVTTTGSTLAAMAKAIKTAGGTTIFGITLCGSAKRV